MCYRSHKCCFINRLYDAIENNKCKESCKRDLQYIKERELAKKKLCPIDRLCLGVGCLKPMFDWYGKERGCYCPIVDEPFIPCLPQPHCLMEIYRECRKDPDAKRIMAHLMNQLDRQTHEKPDFFSKCFIKRMSKDYKKAVKPKVTCVKKKQEVEEESFEEMVERIIADVPLDEPWNIPYCYLFEEYKNILPGDLTSLPFPEKTHLNSPWPWMLPLTGGEGYSEPCTTQEFDQMLRN